MFVVFTSFFSRRVIMAINSTATALHGVEPLMRVLKDYEDPADAGAGIYGLLVMAFELRYTLFRGWF